MAAKKDAIAKVETGGALALPDYAQTGTRKGADVITTEDLVMPRLALAQQLSPELEEGNPKYIDGLKAGDAFNTLTGAVYGKDPLKVIIVRVDPPRFVEFRPRSEGGGIVDFNVPADDPRTKFGEDGEKPVATKFMEYVALLGEELEPVALSFKGSGLKTARQLNGLIKFRNADSYASVFELTPVKMSNDKGTYYTFNVRLAGNTPEEAFNYAAQVFDAVADKTIVTEREEDTPTQVVDGEKAPF